MDIQLRDYQQKFIGDIQEQFENGVNSVVGVAPCGAGKTVMAAAIVKSAIARGDNVLFFVHRKELIDQTANTFCRFGIPFGVISAGNKPNYNLPVQIASVQTLVNRLHQIHKPNLLICDECHHILADSYLRIIKRFNTSKLLGITATPQRMGGVRLGNVFQEMVLAPSIKDLTSFGFLAPFKYFVPDFNLKLDSVHVQRGDYVNGELADLMSKEKVIANIVDNYLLHANGKSAICYCVNIEHSKIVAGKFISAGIPAAQCDGTTDKSLRQKMVDDFRRGKIKILCNAELFGEGFDVPNMDAVILARPTKSLTLFIQQSMRPLRPDPLNPNKIATIIDCANNYNLFGLPDDDRFWSLEPNAEKEPQPPPMKICPECRAVVPLGTRVCDCGYVFPFAELVEKNFAVVEVPQGFKHYLQIAEQRNYKKYWAVIKFLQNDAKTLKDIESVGKFMGYKKGWAKYQWQELQQLRQSRG